MRRTRAARIKAIACCWHWRHSTRLSKMSELIQNRKKIVRWGLAVILALDVALALVNFRLNQSPRIAPEEIKRLDMMEKSYRADNGRLEKFRAELPADEKEWD